MTEHQYVQQPKKTDTIVKKQNTLTQIAPKTQLPSSHPMAIIQRAKINPKSLTHADIMQLQRTIGNRAVGMLLSSIRSSSTAQQATVQRQEIHQDEEPVQGKMTETVQRQEIPEEKEEPLQGIFGKEPEEEVCPSCMQRQEVLEEGPLQGKFENKPHQTAFPSCSAALILQRKEISEEEEPLQGKMIGTVQRQEVPEEPLQTKRENNTGMPDNLKAGVENLSGIDMNDVRVHYNSSKPAEVGALAYTQGIDIHVAPGQERHLPHEAWHVVQQAQGRVQPTIMLKELAVNDDVGLEREADLMGDKTQNGTLNEVPVALLKNESAKLNHVGVCGSRVMQRLIVLDQDMDASRLQAAYYIYNKHKKEKEKITILPKVNLYPLRENEKLYLVAHGDVSPDNNDEYNALDEEQSSLLDQYLELFSEQSKLIEIELGIERQILNAESSTTKDKEDILAGLNAQKDFLNEQITFLEQKITLLITRKRSIDNRLSTWPQSFKHGGHTAKELADILSKFKILQKNVIKLISCNSGDDDRESYAAKLAVELKEIYTVVGIKGLESTSPDGRTRGFATESVDFEKYSTSLMHSKEIQEADDIARKLYSELKSCPPDQDMEKIIPVAKKVLELLDIYFAQTPQEEAGSKNAVEFDKEKSEYTHKSKE